MLTNQLLNDTNTVLREIESLIQTRFIEVYEVYEKNRKIYKDRKIIDILRREKNPTLTDFSQFCNDYLDFWDEYRFNLLIELDYNSVLLLDLEKRIEVYIEDNRDGEQIYFSVSREFLIKNEYEFQKFLEVLDEKFKNVEEEIGKYKIKLENSKIEEEKIKKEKRYKEYLKLKEEFGEF